MNSSIIMQKVKDIVFEVLKDRIKYEEITNESNLSTDLGVDSAEMMEIFLTIMSDFNIEIDRNCAVEMQTINDICIKVNGLLQ